MGLGPLQEVVRQVAQTPPGCRSCMRPGGGLLGQHFCRWQARRLDRCRPGRLTGHRGGRCPTQHDKQDGAQHLRQLSGQLASAKREILWQR